MQDPLLHGKFLAPPTTPPGFPSRAVATPGALNSYHQSPAPFTPLQGLFSPTPQGGDSGALPGESLAKRCRIFPPVLQKIFSWYTHPITSEDPIDSGCPKVETSFLHPFFQPLLPSLFSLSCIISRLPPWGLYSVIAICCGPRGEFSLPF